MHHIYGNPLTSCMSRPIAFKPLKDYYYLQHCLLDLHPMSHLPEILFILPAKAQMTSFAGFMNQNKCGTQEF